jgi:hypothetical protein
MDHGKQMDLMCHQRVTFHLKIKQGRKDSLCQGRQLRELVLNTLVAKSSSTSNVDTVFRDSVVLKYTHLFPWNFISVVYLRPQISRNNRTSFHYKMKMICLDMLFWITFICAHAYVFKAISSFLMFVDRGWAWPWVVWRKRSMPPGVLCLSSRVSTSNLMCQSWCLPVCSIYPNTPWNGDFKCFSLQTKS